MAIEADISPQEIEGEFKKLSAEAKENGYFLNPDPDFAKELIRGILINQKRYGYGVCPCRLSAKNKEKDNDIICPCDYRDADISEFGACYCGLYVSKAAAEGTKKVGSVPDRRNGVKDMRSENENITTDKSLKYPVWRCKVCGYLCARENPPEICPICKVKKERFERFI